MAGVVLPSASERSVRFSSPSLFALAQPRVPRQSLEYRVYSIAIERVEVVVQFCERL